MTSPSVRGRLEACGVVLSSFALACGLTYPLIAKLGSVGRVNTGDGRLSIWNVAWVARTLVVDPLHVFDANIFYPNRGTLAYSENNIGAGILAMPAYWATRNPYAAHNVAVLLAFTLSATGMYYLVRHLTADRRAAVIAAVAFAFSPYLFAHTAHIQLLMTAGLPFAMLAFHRVAERPTPGRGAQLGGVMAAQAVSCGYYGVFVTLMVGFAVLAEASVRRRWQPAYWKAVGVGAVVALVIVIPIFRPYMQLQAETGFARNLDDARSWSADWRAYLASGARLHGWMLPYLGHWNEVLFPGFVAAGLGLAGIWLAAARRQVSVLATYGGLAVLAFLTSLGPAAGLYTVLYEILPVFTWLRAPSRFGIIVAFGLSVLAGVAVAGLVPRTRRGLLVTLALAAVAVAESVVIYPADEVQPLSPAYKVLASVPRGAVLEMPFYYLRGDFPQHTVYMLNSTAHWMPLVNGYSDHLPNGFLRDVDILKFFPSRDAFKNLEATGVRYAVLHMYGYNAENRRDVLGRLMEFQAYLRPLYVDEQTRLYEIVGYPR